MAGTASVTAHGRLNRTFVAADRITGSQEHKKQLVTPGNMWNILWDIRNCVLTMGTNKQTPDAHAAAGAMRTCVRTAACGSHGSAGFGNSTL